MNTADPHASKHRRTPEPNEQLTEVFSMVPPLIPVPKPLLSTAFLWIVSSLVSLFLAMVIGMAWLEKHNEKQAHETKLVTETQAKEFLRDTLPAGVIPTLIPTGVFIQSLSFVSGNEVHLTGYIWQKYPKTLPEDFPKGFILPAAVDSGNNSEPTEVYREDIGGVELIGWFVETTLRQAFDYAHYPLDHKTVKIRIWPKAWGRHAYLLPDLSSYNAPRPGVAFGIDEEIVLGGWREPEETFFEYQLMDYDTDFGYGEKASTKNYPDFFFNIVIRRRLLSAFIVDLVPLLVVTALLFVTLLMVTDDQAKADAHGINTSGVLGTCSALFFVVILAHINLRQLFSGSNIVYLEQFYLFVYGLILAVVANTYLVAIGAAVHIRLLRYRENLIPKLLFWPVVSGGGVVMTYLRLF